MVPQGDSNPQNLVSETKTYAIPSPGLKLVLKGGTRTPNICGLSAARLPIAPLEQKLKGIPIWLCLNRQILPDSTRTTL